MMKIMKITLYSLKMPLKNPFRTSKGIMENRESIIVKVDDGQGFSGVGECVALSDPYYTEETIKTCWIIIEDFLIPLLLGKGMAHPEEVSELFGDIRGNRMAKAALEGAVWDLYCKREDISLVEAIGGVRERIEIGLAIGIKPMQELLESIQQALDSGYKRIKLKIERGKEKEILEGVRNRYPEISLMVDANSDYSLEDLELIKELDKYKLLMIEQPFASNDFIGHSVLQSEIETPVCLDESIACLEDVKLAHYLKSCRIINLKIGRVGGIAEAIRIHDYCRENEIPIWLGGMLETGVGRAQSIAIASLPQFMLPADTAGSSNYWEEDIISPEIVVEAGIIELSKKPGLGYEVDLKRIKGFCKKQKTFSV